jgi:hypothetical protein
MAFSYFQQSLKEALELPVAARSEGACAAETGRPPLVTAPSKTLIGMSKMDAKTTGSERTGIMICSDLWATRSRNHPVYERLTLSCIRGERISSVLPFVYGRGDGATYCRWDIQR